MSYHPTLGRFIQRDPLGYVDGGSLYQYVDSMPEDGLDPSGCMDLPIGDEKWTFTVGDGDHVHSIPEADRIRLGLRPGDPGAHIHGPNGEKFFPRDGIIRDRNGRWSRASDKFMKKFEKVRPRLNQRLAQAGLLGLLLLISMAANEASGANIELRNRIVQDIRIIRSNSCNAWRDSALYDLIDAVQNMFGSDLAGYMLFDNIDMSQDGWRNEIHTINEE